MAHMTEQQCRWCKTKFPARTADVNRGWGLFCSKPCKAKEQEKRTGQNRAHHAHAAPIGLSYDEHEAAMDSMTDWEYGASDGGSST